MSRDWTTEQSELIDVETGQLQLPFVAVSADAGAGKTSTLEERVKRILSLTPENVAGKILCVSFTNKSKADLESRLGSMENVEVYTIHGFCSRLLKAHGQAIGLSPNARMLDETEARELFTEVFERTYRRQPPSLSEHSAKQIFALCSAAREGNVTLRSSIRDSIEPFVKSVLSDYANRKEKLAAMDYVDLEMKALQALSVPSVAHRLGQRYTHLFVDEFQDTSDLQCELIRTLQRTGKMKSLFVVGDSKQSIYRFRGADVEVFEQFVETLPAKRNLTFNFRSHSDVIGAVNAVMALSLKTTQPMQAGRTKSSALTNLSLFEKIPRAARLEAEDPAKAILLLVDNLISAGAKPGDIVFLFRRLRSQKTRELFRELEARGLLVAPMSSTALEKGSALESMAFAFCNAVRPWDRLLSARTVVDHLPLAQGRAGLGEAITQLQLEISSSDPVELFDGLSRQFEFKQRFGILHQIFRTYLLKCRNEGRNAAEIAQVIEEVLVAEQTTLSGLATPPPPENLTNAIRAMTVHAAKGLEFPIVILADLEARNPVAGPVFKSKNDLWFFDYVEGELDKADAKEALAREKDASVSESARLLYVAMTRAEEALYVIDRPIIEVLPSGRKARALPAGSWRPWLKEGMPRTLCADEFQQVLGTAKDSTLSAFTPGPASFYAAMPTPSYVRARQGVTDEMNVKVQSTEIRPRASSSEGDRARRIGTRVHEIFEHEDWDSLAALGSEENLDFSPFLKWLKGAEGQRCFGLEDETKVRIEREFGFTWTREDGVSVTGRADRLVFDLATKQAWILDFKVLLSKKSEGELLKTYLPQFEVYQKALNTLFQPHGFHFQCALVDVLAVSGKFFLTNCF